MTSDKELADAVVALDVGSLQHEDGDGQCHVWVTPNHCGPAIDCHDFVRDWRVAGALMEAKCWGVNTVRKGDEWEAHVVPIGQIREYVARNESPVRAIIEACVMALS